MKRPFFFLPLFRSMNKALSLFGLLMAFCLPVWAQDVKITGTVTDKTLERLTLTGVAVQLKGNKAKGTVTDYDGNYKLTVPAGSTLVFSYIGYKSLEVPIGNKNVINVALEEEGVVGATVDITGKKEASTRPIQGVTNVSTIKASDVFEKAVVPSFDAALQGRATGVQVTQASGIDGGAVNIRIRGTGSVSASSSPLVIVDGIPVTTGAGGDGGGAIGGGASLGFQTNPLADFNPNIIENIEVLKDAGATALYGARGSNGVLLITTKRGKAGKTRFTYSSQIGFSELSNRVELLDGPEYLRVLQQSYRNSWLGNPNNANSTTRTVPQLSTYLTFPVLNQLDTGTARRTNINWMDRLLQANAFQQEHSFTGRGGNERTTFFFAGTYRKSEGILKGNQSQRISGTFNIDNIANERFKFGFSTNLSYLQFEFVPTGTGSGQGGFGTAQTRSLPIFPVFNPNPATNNFPFNPFFNAYGTFAGSNIELTSNRDYAFYNQDVFRNISNFYMDYNIPVDYFNSFTFRSETGLDFRSQLDQNYESRYLRLSDIGVLEPAAAATDQRVSTINYSLNNYLSATKYLDEDNKVSAMVGAQFQRTDFNNNSVRTERFPNDYTFSVQQGQRQITSSGNQTAFAFLSGYGRFNYSWKEKLLTQLSVRYEGSSRFGANNRFGLFYGASAGYLLTEENFFKDITWLDLLKVNVSYGRTGNGAGLDNFQSYGLYGSGATYNLQPGIRPTRFANPNLSWEKADQLDVYAETEMFKRRLFVKLGYYNRTSKDLLLGLPTPPSLGIQDGQIFSNVGSLRNQGVEFEFSTVNLSLKKKVDEAQLAADILAGKSTQNSGWNFEWTTDFNITFQDVEMLSIGNLRPQEVSGSLDFATFVGEGISTFYMPLWAGVDPNTGEELIYKAERDANGQLTGRVTNEKIRAERIGQLDSNRVPHFNRPTQPRLFGGITNNFRLGNAKFGTLNISVLFTYQEGNYILDQGERRQSYVTGQNNLRRDALNAWTPNNRNTDYPKLYYSNAPGVYNPSQDAGIVQGYNVNDPYRFRNTSRFIHDGSFIRLKTLSVSYTLPNRVVDRLKMTNIRLFFNAQNVLTFTKFPGWDPEVLGNLQSNSEQNLQTGRTDLDFPQIRSYVLGISAEF